MEELIIILNHASKCYQISLALNYQNHTFTDKKLIQIELWFRITRPAFKLNISFSLKAHITYYILASTKFSAIFSFSFSPANFDEVYN